MIWDLLLKLTFISSQGHETVMTQSAVTMSLPWDGTLSYIYY